LTTTYSTYLVVLYEDCTEDIVWVAYPVESGDIPLI
jgi:hypothetical protein